MRLWQAERHQLCNFAYFPFPFFLFSLYCLHYLAEVLLQKKVAEKAVYELNFIKTDGQLTVSDTVKLNPKRIFGTKRTGVSGLLWFWFILENDATFLLLKHVRKAISWPWCYIEWKCFVVLYFFKAACAPKRILWHDTQHSGDCSVADSFPARHFIKSTFEFWNMSFEALSLFTVFRYWSKHKKKGVVTVSWAKIYRLLAIFLHNAVREDKLWV